MQESICVLSGPPLALVAEAESWAGGDDKIRDMIFVKR